MRLKDKVAIVTGAGGGLGKATVLTFVKEAAKVVIDDVTNKIYDVQKETEMLCGEVLPIKADVSRWGQIKNMTEKTLDKWHRIDILVNNAANFGARKQIIDLEEEEWERTLSVNLKGIFLCCKAVIPIMKEQKYGKIINVASLARVVVGPRFTGLDYAASKSGVVGLTKALAMQCGPWGINVNVVVPGYMKLLRY